MILKAISTWLNWLERLMTALTGGILGVLTLLVAWQVVGRYVFNVGLFWADELTGIAMMWAALLGAAGCIWTDSHMRLRLIIDRIPPSPRVWLLTLMDGVVVWFALVFFKEGMTLVERTMGGRLSSLDIPIGITYVVLPVAAVLMVAFALMVALNRLSQHYRGKGGEP
jgi:TRAP-type C4-dicarboxylate transport system permease small subunit